MIADDVAQVIADRHALLAYGKVEIDAHALACAALVTEDSDLAVQHEVAHQDAAKTGGPVRAKRAGGGKEIAIAHGRCLFLHRRAPGGLRPAEMLAAVERDHLTGHRRR
ncbi:MAG: hypothetical protein ACLQJR_08745 [Stellaceae bacterium]